MCSSVGSLDTSLNSHPYLSFMNSSFFDFEHVDQLQTAVIKTEQVSETSGSSVFSLLSPPASPSFLVPDGLSPANFLDSPFFPSNSDLPQSLTNETFPENSFDSTNKKENPGFTLEMQANPGVISSPESIFTSSMAMGDSYMEQQQPYMHEALGAQTHYTQPMQTARTHKKSEDGYNWRKYGQKQLKGSENPRGYYKCSFPICPTKKKVEWSLEGKITETLYKGSHNHPKPQFTGRAPASHAPEIAPACSQVPEQFANIQVVSSVAPENSSSSNGEDDFDRNSKRKGLRGNELDEDEQPEPKKWKQETEIERISCGIRTVREPKVTIQTMSDIDIIDDGYRWRKYGQKVVKANPNPRSYYKCTNVECPVRKHVERASHDMNAVITTYEEKHNHEVPAARGRGNHSVDTTSQNNTTTNNNMTSTVPNGPVANSSFVGNLIGSTLPASEGQAHFTIEMLQNRLGGYQCPDYYSSMDSPINQLQQTDSSVFL